MSTLVVDPSILVSGGSWGDENWSSNYDQLQITLENLLSGAADLAASGTKTIILGSNEIQQAWSYMTNLGETQAQVTASYNALVAIADYCRQNGITVEVEADLTNPATNGNGTNAAVQQWAPIAAEVGLPISRIQDVNEMATQEEFVTSAASFSAMATVEANAVRTLLLDYQSSSYELTASNLQVGDMEGGTASSSTAWWSAYDQAAQAMGVPEFSFYTSDPGQYAPWINTISTTATDQVQESMSAAATASGLSTNMLVAGAEDDLTPFAYVAQAEQNAMSDALLVASGSLSIASLEIQTWESLPVGVDLVTSPTSLSNEAAEIAATFSLAASGLITAAGTASLGAPAQIVLATGVHQTVPGLTITWSTADASAGKRLSVVLVDQTGTLTATQHGAGTVNNDGSNVLVLSGTSLDLAAELASVVLSEAVAGPDTLDIEAFGTEGRLSDVQVSIFAVSSGASTSAIASTSGQQGWLSASAMLNTGTVVAPGSILTSETMYWSTEGYAGGTIGASSTASLPQFVDVVSIHEPLAEYGVENASSIVLGTTVNAIVDIYNSTVDWQPFIGNDYANDAGVNNMVSPQTSTWNAGFDAAAAVTPMVVASTVNTFNPVTGQQLSTVNALAPDPITVSNLSGSYPDAYATAFDNGGTQVIEYNVAGNAGWNQAWGNQFSSVTLTYDDVGTLVEAVLQGGASDPWFVVDDVFDPNTGALWEQFQTTTPPPASANGSTYSGTTDPYEPGFVSGPLFITQFNTGDNPNWDYLDWGSTAASDTEVWTDYFAMANFTGFALSYAGLSAGDIANYPFQFVNGSTLDLMYLPGTNVVNLNQLGTVTIDSQVLASGLSNLTEIDAAGASGVVNITGLLSGGCVLIGGNGVSTITGYGHDTIVAGVGATTINTGGGGSTIELLAAGEAVSVAGNNNTVDATSGSTLTISGTGDTILGSSVAGTIAAVGAVVSESGTDNVFRFINGGTLIQIGSTSSVSVLGNADTIAASSGSSVTVSGTNDIISGTAVAVGVAAGVVGLLIDGASDVVSAASGAAFSLMGGGYSLTASGVSISVLANAGLTLSGSEDVISVWAGASITIAAGTGNTAIGSNATITIDSGATINVSGTNNVVNLVGPVSAIDVANGNTVFLTDSAADIFANLAALEALAAAGTLGGIALTNASASTDTFTEPSLTADASVLAVIHGAWSAGVTGAAAADAAGLAALPYVSSVAVVDIAADVAANIGALETVAANGKLAGVWLTGTATPTLSISDASLAADQTALRLMQTPYILDPNVADATLAASLPNVLQIEVVDTAANVVAGLATLETLAAAGRISAIQISDGAQLTLSAAQVLADTAVMPLLVQAAGPSGIDVSDAIGAIDADQTQLSQLATAGEISTITISGYPDFAISLPGTLLASALPTINAEMAEASPGSYYTWGIPGLTLIESQTGGQAVWTYTNAPVIRLAGQMNMVELAGSDETVYGGSGWNGYCIDDASAGATIVGGSGGSGTNNLFVEMTAATFAMGANFSGIDTVWLGSVPEGFSFAAGVASGLVIRTSDDSATVTVGAASQAVLGGEAAVHVVATAATAGALVQGGSGGATLEITSGGAAALNGADTNLFVSLDAATNLQLGAGAFITAEGAVSAGSTLVAGAAGQTLTGRSGADTLIGYGGFGDTFSGTASGLSGDVIMNFGGNDVIDVTDLSFAALHPLSFVSGILQATDGAHTVDLTMSGGFSAASFLAISDGHSGTLIKLAGH